MSSNPTQFSPTMSVSLSGDHADAHRLPSVLVDDNPVSQWRSKVDLNWVQTIVATSKGSGGANDLNLHLGVRLSQMGRFWVSVAGIDDEYEPV